MCSWRGAATWDSLRCGQASVPDFFGGVSNVGENLCAEVRTGWKEGYLHGNPRRIVPPGRTPLGPDRLRDLSFGGFGRSCPGTDESLALSEPPAATPGV